MVFGAPGQKSGVALRILQATLSLISFLTLFFAPHFAHLTVLPFLLNSQGAQVIWSFIVAGMDGKGAVFGGPRPSPLRVRFTCLFDWFIGFFSFGSMNAAAAVVLWLWKSPICDKARVSCTMILVSAVFAFFAWCVQTFLTLVMSFFMVASFY